MLHNIERTFEAGGYTFPTRADYTAHFGSANSRAIDRETIVSIQRDWHMRGQNGCVFAMHAARKMNERQWRHEVYRPPYDLDLIRRHISSEIDDPQNDILSLLFPVVECEATLQALIDLAIAVGCHVATEPSKPGMVSLRYSLNDVESWIVGFAPILGLPETRRAPFAELVIRTKVKPSCVHPGLNSDATQAHLADIDLSLKSNVVTRLIKTTIERTAKILGGSTARRLTESARAKVTYGLTTKNHETECEK